MLYWPLLCHFSVNSLYGICVLHYTLSIAWTFPLIVFTLYMVSVYSWSSLFLHNVSTLSILLIFAVSFFFIHVWLSYAYSLPCLTLYTRSFQFHWALLYLSCVFVRDTLIAGIRHPECLWGFPQNRSSHIFMIPIPPVCCRWINPC